MQARPDLTPSLAALACEPELGAARIAGAAALDAGAQGVLVDGFVVHAPPASADALREPSAAPAPDSDEFLMHAFAAGDADAFTRLYDRHERATWRFIRHRLGGQHEAAADDVLQETWISVARAAPRYVATARFTTWLFTIARSRVIDHLRAQSNAALSIDAPSGGETGDDAGDERWVDRLPADAADGPLARVESRRQAEAFLAALDQLPAPQREAFVLQAEGGLSVDEVARATGVGAETAKTRLRYAKAKLRSLLEAWRPT
jgi:RNA polymerase sigma factor (sigma-70 family)